MSPPPSRSLFLSVLMAIFPGEAGFTGAKDDGGSRDNWSYKTCKAPVKSSPPANQHPTFYRPDALPVAQLNAPKHWALFDTNASVMKKSSQRDGAKKKIRPAADPVPRGGQNLISWSMVTTFIY